MKAFLALLAICTLSAATVLRPKPKSSRLVDNEFARNVATYIVGNMLKQGAIKPLAIIPDIPDPLEIGSGDLSIAELGNINYCFVELLGGSNVADRYDINVEVDPKISYFVDTQRLELKGTADVDVNAGGLLRILANGAFTINWRSFHADLTMQFDVFEFPPGTFRVLGADLNWVLDTLYVEVENATGNGSPIDWEQFNPVIRSLIDNYWETNEVEIEELILTVASQVTESCNIFELVGGDTSCINLPFDIDLGSLVQEELADFIQFNINADPACPVVDPPVDPEPQIKEYFVYSENITTEGEWGELERCQGGAYVQGFSLKVEPEGQTDDTSLNAIRLYCGSDESSRIITSLEGPFGSYGIVQFCEDDGYVNGFQLRSEDGGNVDDTAANNFRIYCSSNALVAKQGDGNSYGKWRKVNKCEAGYGVCGIKTQVEPSQGFTSDDTALNNVALLCCLRD